MMTTKEMIGIMQAYECGKLIEYRLKNEDTWTLISTPSWDWVKCDYRIKPKDSYRPYKDAAEFLNHLATKCKLTRDLYMEGVWLKNIHTYWQSIHGPRIRPRQHLYSR